MLFFSVLAFSLELLNYLGVTQFPLFTVEFLVSIVYTPTAVLGVGYASPRLMKLSRNSRLLLTSLGAYVIFDILLTPVGGLETRPVSDVTTSGFVTLGLLFAGLLLAVAAAGLLFVSLRVSSLVGILGAILYFPAFVSDEVGLFSAMRAPIGIALLELVQAIAAAFAVFFAIRVHRETRKHEHVIIDFPRC